MRSLIAAAVMFFAFHASAADAGHPSAPPLMKDEAPVAGSTPESTASNAGTNAPATTAQSATELQKACDAKNGAACVTLGVRVEHGRDGEKASDVRAAELYRKGCDANEPSACSAFASMLESGRGVSKSVSRAASLHERSCRNGFGAACTRAARLYAQPGAVNLLPDYESGAKLLELGCDANDASACQLLGEYHEVGRGVATPNAHRAHGFFSKACELGSKGACNQKDRIDRGHTRRPTIDIRLP